MKREMVSAEFVSVIAGQERLVGRARFHNCPQPGETVCLRTKGKPESRWVVQEVRHVYWDNSSSQLYELLVTSPADKIDRSEKAKKNPVRG